MRSTKLPLWTERLLGLAPPEMPPPHAFTLDERTLRYGCFSRGSRGFVYETSRAWELPDDVFGSGILGAPVREPNGFQALLEDFLRELPPIKAASLVLPDTWLRLTFIEIAELPRRRQARFEMLRWKLKRKLPFRVEDLRISEQPVTPFPDQEEPLRLLVGFAIELLIQQLETAFADAGVEIGRITNTTLALAASLQHSLSPDDLAGLVAVQPDAFTLSFYSGGEPLLYRYKALGAGPVSSSAIHRELRLTNSFVRQHFPQQPLARLFLATPEGQEEPWQEWLYEEFDAAPEPLAFEHFPIARTQVGPSWLETAALLGAASDEVSWR